MTAKPKLASEPSRTDEGQHPQRQAGQVEEFYQGHRISIRDTGNGWVAKVWSARGPVVPVSATATPAEGHELCLVRAREGVERYLSYVRRHGGHGSPTMD